MFLMFSYPWPYQSRPFWFNDMIFFEGQIGINELAL